MIQTFRGNFYVTICVCQMSELHLLPRIYKHPILFKLPRVSLELSRVLPSHMKVYLLSGCSKYLTATLLWQYPLRKEGPNVQLSSPFDEMIKIYL